jgi:hypothetical protein
MNKARLIFLLCSLTTAAWSFPAMSVVKCKYFGGGSWFDGG